MHRLPVVLVTATSICQATLCGCCNLYLLVNLYLIVLCLYATCSRCQSSSIGLGRRITCAALFGDRFASCRRSLSEEIKKREVLKNGEVSALLVRIVSRHVQDSLVSVSTIIGSRQRSLFDQCLDMSNTRLYRFPL
jgi:hypothetical protein